MRCTSLLDIAGIRKFLQRASRERGYMPTKNNAAVKAWLQIG